MSCHDVVAVDVVRESINGDDVDVRRTECK
jgi:hypothetical protein